VKEEMMVQAEVGGVVKVGVPKGYEKEASISDDTAVELAKLLIEVERKMGSPQDFEWAVEGGVLYCLQTRPIVTLPPTCFYDNQTVGGRAVLWDNSNIVESYSGVTSPLTFSFVSRAYTEVYTMTLKVCQVPLDVIESYKPYVSNMLGLVRGNIYYNLVNWYRYVSCMPVGDSAKFMETMMGVKQTLEPELEAELGRIQDSVPKYGYLTKMKVVYKMLHSIFFIDGMVEGFFANFNKHYEDALQRDFREMSLVDQVDFVEHLFKDVLGHWEVPIINDAYVMLFFGLLKKMVQKYLVEDSTKAESLQNDLLCGQGNVESTEPTKMLMRIAEYVDSHSPQLREWFVEEKTGVLDMLREEVEVSLARREGSAEPMSTSSDGLRQRRKGGGASLLAGGEKDPPSVILQEKRNVVQTMRLFLARYGFRCINELKLEENTLHDDPGFLYEMIRGYVRSKTYSIADMEAKEVEIRSAAEKIISEKLQVHQRLLFNWVLFHARRGVRHRENMRFARTKLFGIFRTLFRGIGHNLRSLKQLDDRQDVFYLTLDEIISYVEGRSVTTNLRGLVELRKKEYEGYRKGLPPPERFMTKGACGITFEFPQLLDDLNLLKEVELEAASDPNVLRGVPCCPGVVDGVVRVVKTVDEAEGLDGEILVTARTDPGWVPLYPLCSGLIIERGSLLSHSAVVARELGLPTIVSVSGGLMKRLKTGMRVIMDAGKGTVTIPTKEE
jgi:pyruvate,water dikinase